MKRGVQFSFFFCMMIVMLVLLPVKAEAGLASDDAFEGAVWEKIIEDDIAGTSGVVQSLCVTDDYIVCIENTSDSSKELDVIRAYYRNNTDAEGNPVKQYSLAKCIENVEYEHANGMAYNPNTGEIAVALYINTSPENRGSIYLMDAKTLMMKGKVNISDDYNILGIGYDTEKDRYVIQTDEEGGYSFKILDNEFQIIEDLGEYADTCVGYNFQDLCVSGDYIINFPLTINLNIGNYIQVYSIPERKLVSAPKINFPFEDAENIAVNEPESICELGAGAFAAVVNITYKDGRKAFCIYKTVVPYEFEKADVTEVVKNRLMTGLRRKEEEKNQAEEQFFHVDLTETMRADTGSLFGKGGDRTVKIVGITAMAAVILLGLLCGLYRKYLSVRRERNRKLEQVRRERDNIKG